MISGREALDRIEATRSQEQTALLQLEQALDAQLREQEALLLADLEDYRALARLRLEDLSRGEVVGRLERAEREALALLSQREEARAALQARLAQGDAHLATLAEARAAAEAAAARARADVEAAEAGTRARLAQDAAYVEAEAQAHKLDIQAANADEKATRSEAELEEKRAAYEDNALFSYLWKRHYGTPDYAAAPLIRTLDAWVARLVGYTDARANFARLREIPKRLREHAEALAVEADAAEEALDALWRAARAQDGLGALDAALAAAEAELDRIADETEAASAERQDLVEELGRFATGEDRHSLAAVELITSELRERDITTLFRQARETLRSEDDRIVGRILDRRQELSTLEASRRQLRDTLERRVARLRDLGDVSREFQRRDYARANSVFRDGALVSSVLRDFLNGAMSQDGLFDQLGRQQRWVRTSPRPVVVPRRSVTFGGGSRGGGRSGGFGGGRSSRGGGGGFSTRGGF